MGGLGSVIGGALSGIGAGIAQQGQLDFQQRRDMALENLRNQNQQANMRVQAEEQRTTQEAGAKLDDWKDSRSNERRTSSTMTIDKNRSALDTAQRERLAKLETQLRTQQSVQTAQIEAQIRSGEITDTLQDDQGNFYAVYKDGRTKPLNIKGAPKAPTGGSAGGLIFDRAGGGGAPPANRPPLSSFGG